MTFFNSLVTTDYTDSPWSETDTERYTFINCINVLYPEEGSNQEPKRLY